MGALTDIQIKQWVKAKVALAKADGGGLTFTLSSSGRASWVLRYRIGLLAICDTIPKLQFMRHFCGNHEDPLVRHQWPTKESQLFRPFSLVAKYRNRPERRVDVAGARGGMP